MKTYRLLRNNKESGPFSAEELKEMGLKPLDLIWVNGKSASWRYPGEVDELKPFAPPVGEQPFDRFFKKKEQPEPQLITAEIDEPEVKPIQQDIKPLPEVKTEEKVQKPRIRVKAEWSVASEPVKKVIEEVKPKPQSVLKKEEKPVPVTTAADDNFGWQEALHEWKKTTPLVAKPGAVAAGANNQNDRIAFDTGMLEADPKEEALNTYYDKREKLVNASADTSTKKVYAGKYLNYIAPILFIIAIGVFAIYMNKKNESEVNLRNGQQVENTALQPKIGEDENAATKSVNADSLNKPSSTLASSSDVQSSVSISTTKLKTQKPSNSQIVVSKPIATVVSKPAASDRVGTRIMEMEKAANNKKDNSTEKSTPDVNKSIAKTNTPINNTANNKPLTEAPPTTKTDNSTPVNTSTTATIDKPVVTEKKAPASIGSFVKLQTVTQPEGNKRLQVHNLSDYKLDLVVIDIQYFDAANKFTKGESIYLHNIPAGKNMLVNTPDDKSASRITAKVSLVSSDEKGIYLVGE